MSRISKLRTESEIKSITPEIVAATIESNTKAVPGGISFINPHDKSRFVLPNGKEIVFNNCVHTTKDEYEIEHLRAAVKSSGGIIREHSEEDSKEEENKEKENEGNGIKIPNVPTK